MLERVKARGRALALRRMTATCTVYRKVGQRRDGVRLIAQWQAVYTGPCERMSRDEQPSTGGADMEATRTVTVSRVRLPVGSFRPEVGDVVRITSSSDPLMGGDLLRISQSQPVKEHATAYRPYVSHLDGDDLADFEQGEVIA